MRLAHFVRTIWTGSDLTRHEVWSYRALLVILLASLPTDWILVPGWWPLDAVVVGILLVLVTLGLGKRGRRLVFWRAPSSV